MAALTPKSRIYPESLLIKNKGVFSPIKIVNPAGTQIWAVDTSGNQSVAGTSTVTGAQAVTGNQTVTGNTAITGTLTAQDIRPSVILPKNYKYTYEEFRTQPTSVSGALAGTPTVYVGQGAPTGATNDMNLWNTGANIFEMAIKGTQTLLVPKFSATGLNITQDQTDNDGGEITQGITARSKAAFTIGTDAAFYFSVQFRIADASGIDDLLVGFRKTQGYQATSVATYTDFAGLGFNTAADPAAIKVRTQLNNAGAQNVDTTQTWADTTTHTFTTLVSAAGVTTFKLDGAAPTATAAFTFDSTDVVVPFFYYLFATTSPGAVEVLTWECGYQGVGAGA